MLRDQGQQWGLPEPHQSGWRFSSPGPHVLIADDDPAARSLLGASAEALGADFIQVSSGHAAWAAIQNTPQLLLAVVNWMLPGMDGCEIVRRARCRSLPCRMILMVGNAFLPDVMHLLSDLPDAYLAKPFSLDQARDLIERVLVDRPYPSRPPLVAKMPSGCLGGEPGGAHRA